LLLFGRYFLFSSFPRLVIHEVRNVDKNGLRKYSICIKKKKTLKTLHCKHFRRNIENYNLLCPVWKTICRNTLLFNTKLPNYCDSLRTRSMYWEGMEFRNERWGL